MKVFLSCSFRDEDEPIVWWFEKFLKAFDIDVIKASGQIPPPVEQVEEGIKNSDFVCVVITERITERGVEVPAWILTEVGMVISEKKILIAFVEECIPKDKLGIIPEIIEYKTFNRESLGKKAPEYVKYINNACRSWRKKLGKGKLLDRIKELQTLANKLKKEVEIDEAQRDRLDDF